MLHRHQPHVAPKLRNAAAAAVMGPRVPTYPDSMARPTGSWLSGSEAGSDAGPDDYPGQRLGLPEHGPGSIARFGRRLAALLIDWFIAYGLVGLAVAFGLISQQTLSTGV